MSDDALAAALRRWLAGLKPVALGSPRSHGRIAKTDAEESLEDLGNPYLFGSRIARPEVAYERTQRE
jgi:hypothetical protein